MLEQARQAVAASNFASFDGNSGAELYRDVLQLDAENEPARAGLEQALDSAIGGAWRALSAGQLDAATDGMEAVRLIAPAHRGLTELVTAIEAETARRLADATERELMEQRQRQIQAALTQMAARLQAGALLEPESDNAIIHFDLAQGLSAGDAAVRAARNELTAALVAAGDRALQARRTRDARRHAAAASEINSSAAGLAALYRRIEERERPAAPQPRPVSTLPSAAEMARTLEVLVQTFPESPGPAEPQLGVPETPAPGGEPAWVPGEGVVPAGQLEERRRGVAEYPPAARVGQVTGWVELEFTVARNGSVKDIEVIAAEPRRTFDSAAIAALRDYRYSPVLRDGQPVEQRARLRFNFRNP
jgi:TonB family protein